MITDPIADMLTIIRNGFLSKAETVNIRYSNFKKELVIILKKLEFIEDFEILKEKNHQTIKISLKYKNAKPALTGIKRVSKPGLRIYAKNKKVPKTLGGIGATIVSTPKGLMTDGDAKRSGLGGEIICKVW